MSDERLTEFQERIAAALRESPDEPASRFSDYLPGPREHLLQRLIEASGSGGVEGMSGALDEFDRLAKESDLGALRSALMLFLVHHPVPRELALTVPGVLQRRGALVARAKQRKGRAEREN